MKTGLFASWANGAGIYSYAVRDSAIVAEMGCNTYTDDATEQGQNCSGVFIQENGAQGYPLEIYEPTSKTC